MKVRQPSRWLPIALLFASFASYSAVRAPIPAVNEPHYLVKARNFWQPEWCAGDLFLESANPHAVFYATIGGLASVVPLELAAGLGRAIALLILAIGWDRLLSQMLPGRWAPLATAWVFLLLQAWGNFAGEWLIGGVESKVVSYALVLWGCGELLAGRPLRGSALLGGAVSFHPVVGAWCLICLGGATLLPPLIGLRRRVATDRPVSPMGATSDAVRHDDRVPLSPARRVELSERSAGGDGRGEGPDGKCVNLSPHPQPLSPDEVPGSRRVLRRGEGSFRFRTNWPAIAAGVACSLPGLIPAARMLSHADPSLAVRADIIQVAIRLDHHLDPYMFPWSAYLYYALMIAVWLLLRRTLPPESRLRRLDAFVGMAIAVAAAGWLAAAGPRPITHLPWLAWRLKLLKLYPFRIADLAVPFALAATLTQLAALHLSLAHSRRRTVLACGFALAFALALLLPGVDRNPSRMPPSRRADWIAALRWIDANTPANALLWAADEDWAVKWFAQRPEFVNFKDCPQDAAGIVEWYERRVRLAEWKLAAAKDRRFTPDELAALHSATGITYVIASRLGPVESPPVYENASFRIYAIAGE